MYRNANVLKLTIQSFNSYCKNKQSIVKNSCLLQYGIVNLNLGFRVLLVTL